MFKVTFFSFPLKSQLITHNFFNRYQSETEHAPSDPGIVIF